MLWLSCRVYFRMASALRVKIGGDCSCHEIIRTGVGGSAAIPCHRGRDPESYHMQACKTLLSAV